MANGTEVTDGQIYNYIAKGGTSESDILVESKVPDYTVIEKEADIGIKLPVMKVNTPSKTGAEVKYAVTDNGVIFIWPPFPHEEKYYVNENETVDADVISSSGELEIKVADKLLKIESNEEGEIQTKEIIYDGLTRKEFEEIKEKVKVGDYVNYTPTSATIQTDPTKTGYGAKETLTTDTRAKWRILSIDEDTGKVLITTQGPVNSLRLSGAKAYLYGVNELHRLCEKLYSNTTKSLVAKSMTIENLDESVDYKNMNKVDSMAYYSYGTDKILDVILNNEKYIGIAHGTQIARFYTFINTNGIEETVNDELEYKVPTLEEPVLIKNTFYLYNPKSLNSIVGDILGETFGWLGSTDVYIGGDYVGFDLRHAKGSTTSDGLILIDSFGRYLTCDYGLRPVVSFNINRLNISDATKTGTETAPWEIK